MVGRGSFVVLGFRWAICTARMRSGDWLVIRMYVHM